MAPRATKKKSRASSKKAARKKTVASRRGILARIIDSRFIGPVVRSKRVRRLAALSALGAFLLSVFTVPVKDFVSQRRVLAQVEKEYNSYADANEALQIEVNRLQTPEGVRAAARDQLGYVLPGEKRVRLLPSPALPTDLPGEWPYTMVSGILAVRSNIASANNAPLAPLSP